MLLTEYDIEDRPVRRLPSPGKCIYCRTHGVELTDEHVVPYAIGMNVTILEKSCCMACQRTIQPYEQKVLRSQLGAFRAMVEAPTRRKKDRPTSVTLPFMSTDAVGRPLRDLGTRQFPLKEAPLILNLWRSPPPRILGLPIDPASAEGRPWGFVEREVANKIIESVSRETGSPHVGMILGQVDRKAYLRTIAKTAHAYAAAELGVESFEPFLTDLVLNRSDDLGQLVGDLEGISSIEGRSEHSFKIALGEIPENANAGPGLVMVAMQLWAELGTPQHVVVVGRTLVDMQAHFAAHRGSGSGADASATTKSVG